MCYGLLDQGEVFGAPVPFLQIAQASLGIEHALLQRVVDDMPKHNTRGLVEWSAMRQQYTCPDLLGDVCNQLSKVPCILGDSDQ